MFSLATVSLHTGSVVCQGVREGNRSGKQKGETKGTEAKSTPKIHQGLWLHLSFQCDFYHPIMAGRIK